MWVGASILCDPRVLDQVYHIAIYSLKSSFFYQWSVSQTHKLLHQIKQGSSNELNLKSEVWGTQWEIISQTIVC